MTGPAQSEVYEVNAAIAKLDGALPGRDEVTRGNLADMANLLGEIQAAARQLEAVAAALEGPIAAVMSRHDQRWEDGLRAERSRSTKYVWDDEEVVTGMAADLLAEHGPVVWEVYRRLRPALPKNVPWRSTEVGRYIGDLDELRAAERGPWRVRVTLPTR